MKRPTVGVTSDPPGPRETWLPWGYPAANGTFRILVGTQTVAYVSQETVERLRDRMEAVELVIP